MVDKEVSSEEEPAAGHSAQVSHGHWHLLLGLLLGLVVGAGGMFWWVQRDVDRHVAVVQAELLQANLGLQTELQAMQSRFENQQGQLLMEQGTRQGLETALKAAQAELGRVREKMAFFDQLLPAGSGGVVSVRGLEITPSDTTLFYRVLLTRQSPASGNVFSGKLMFEAKGVQDGKAIELPLEFVTDAEGNDAGEREQAVSFEWFLRQEGYLRVPPGFKLDELVLRLYEGKTLKLSHTVDLP